MVSFRIIVTSALVLTVPVVAQLTQEQLAGNITTLGNNANALERTARNIKPVNGIGAILGTGPLGVVVNGIKLLTKILLALSLELGSEGPVLKPSAKAIEVYKEFFIFGDDQEKLLNTMAGKAGVYRIVPGNPVVQALREFKIA